MDLSHPRIDDVFSRMVAASLHENRVVTTVILSCLAIVDDGAYHLGMALAKHKMLRSIQLRDLRDQREINIFFDQLAQHGDIREASLRHTQICYRCVDSIVNFIRTNSKLQELRIVDSQIDEASQKKLFRGIEGHKSLQRVYLINGGVSSIAIPFLIDMLEESSVEELHLCENDMEDEGTCELATGLLKNNTLRHLNLRSNGITDNASLSLQGMLFSCPQLKNICLSNNELGDLGVAALARGLSNPRCGVKEMDLCCNNIGVNGSVALAQMLKINKTLTTLNLSFNEIGDDGASALAASLVRNRTLQGLNLKRCGITNQGAQRIAQHLEKMHGLKELILASNKITTQGYVALLDGIRRNVEIEYMHVEDKISEPVLREILHWIRLNKAGRRIFQRPNIVQVSLWPQVYGRISTNFDILYHFIKETPSVMNTSLERTRKRKHLL